MSLSARHFVFAAVALCTGVLMLGGPSGATVTSGARDDHRAGTPTRALRRPSISVDQLYDRLEQLGLAGSVALLRETEAGSEVAPQRPPRASCAECGEPVELYNESDPESWIHARDARDAGDHPASVEAAWAPPRNNPAEPPPPGRLTTSPIAQASIDTTTVRGRLPSSQPGNEKLGGLVAILDKADAADRAELHEALGVGAKYDAATHTAVLEVEPAWGQLRVGGGT